MTPYSAAILGALTADAAALGLHWLYDAKRLRDLQLEGPLAFRSPDRYNYRDVPGYFAHDGKRAGDPSCYGAPCRLMLAHLAHRAGRFELRRFQQEWLATFGPGGSWVGYADRPTRRTVVRLLGCASADDFPAVSGVDDDQLPALASIAALVAGHRGPLASLNDDVQAAVAVTHDHPLAREAAAACTLALHAVVNGTPLQAALRRGAEAAGDTLAPLLHEALALPALDPQGATARFGMPCHLPQGLPVLFHIANRAAGFAQAAEANILAGGDSCGRSLMLGALTAASDTLRAASSTEPSGGIPLAWLSRLHGLADIVRDVDTLIGA